MRSRLYTSLSNLQLSLHRLSPFTWPTYPALKANAHTTIHANGPGEQPELGRPWKAEDGAEAYRVQIQLGAQRCREEETSDTFCVNVMLII
jgi:hypothetical protein